MTVVETLTMYGRLRGIQESQIPTVVKSLMHSLLLDEHAKKQAGELRYEFIDIRKQYLLLRKVQCLCIHFFYKNIHSWLLAFNVNITVAVQHCLYFIQHMFYSYTVCFGWRNKRKLSTAFALIGVFPDCVLHVMNCF